MLFLLNPLIGAFYLLYIDQLIKRWERVPHRLGLMTLMPVLLNSFFVIRSLFNGMIFTIDATNTYVRGEYFFLVSICNFIYFIGGQLHLVLGRKDFPKQTNSLLIHFPFPIMVAALLQMHIPGLNILNVALSLTLLLVFLHMQHSQASRDYLTSLYNRSLCEEYLSYLFLHRKPWLHVGGILLDIDTFKEMNDTFGHDMGDRTLRLFAKMLSDSAPKNWLVGRYGGDEFLLLSEVDSLASVQEAVTSLQEGLELVNSKHLLPVPLGMSIGYGADEELTEKNPNFFVKLLDERMYKQKREHRHQEAPSRQ